MQTLDISLRDEQGRLINLHGVDWQLTLHFNVLGPAGRAKRLRAQSTLACCGQGLVGAIDTTSERFESSSPKWDLSEPVEDYKAYDTSVPKLLRVLM